MGEEERLQRSWVANTAAWCAAVRDRRIESRSVTDAAIVEAVLEGNPRRVLDVGCGEGWLVRALALHDVAVTGVDASPPLIEAARAAGRSSRTFSLLDDRAEELLRALRSNLSAGGRLIVQTVHPVFSVDGDYRDGWRTGSFTGIAGEWPEAMPWYFRTIGSWSRMLRDAGYSIEEMREPVHPDRAIPASIVFICRGRRRHTAGTTDW